MKKKIFKNDDPNDLLTLQIKYAISNINAQYVNKTNEIMSPLCDYYCNCHINNNNKNLNDSNNNAINNNEKKNKNSNRYNNIYYNKFSKCINYKNYK